MLLLPWGTTSQAAFVLSRVVIGGALTLCLMLLASGVYQIAATGWRDRSLVMDLELISRLAYIATACLGFLTYSSLLRIWQTAKLWLCLAASLLCLAASVFQGLRHGFQLTRTSVWTAAVALLLAMINSVALCLVHSERRLPPPPPRTHPHPQHPGGFIQQRPQPQPVIDFAARYDGQQILHVPQITHTTTTVLLPPPLLPPQPPQPPPYAPPSATFEAATVKPPEYSQIYP